MLQITYHTAFINRVVVTIFYYNTYFFNTIIEFVSYKFVSREFYFNSDFIFVAFAYKYGNNNQLYMHNLDTTNNKQSSTSFSRIHFLMTLYLTLLREAIALSIQKYSQYNIHFNNRICLIIKQTLNDSSWVFLNNDSQMKNLQKFLITTQGKSNI